jgi:uncharacterized protein DUF3987/bifunctional DNA primase/polymerase-like protein
MEDMVASRHNHTSEAASVTTDGSKMPDAATHPVTRISAEQFIDLIDDVQIAPAPGVREPATLETTQNGDDLLAFDPEAFTPDDPNELAKYRAAQEYIARGYALVLLYGVQDEVCSCPKSARCTSPGKHPIGLNWQKRPIRSSDALARACSKRYGSPTNLGLFLHNGARLLLVDEDNKNGKNGAATIREWEVKLSIRFERYLVQHTPTGGRHYLLSVPAAFPIERLPNGAVAAGVDVLRDDRQFVLAPSSRPSGQYRCAGSDAVSLPRIDELHEAPDALLEFLASMSRGSAQGTSTPVDLEALKAPNVDVVRKVVQNTPHNDDVSYYDYVAAAHYIKGACGQEHEADAREIFDEWADRWEGGFNAPDTNEEKFNSISWTNLHSGWRQLLTFAREQGCSKEVLAEVALAEAQEEFEADPNAAPAIDDWEEPIPLFDCEDREKAPFPLESLPPQMRKLVVSVAASLEVPIDFAAIVLIGAVAGAAQRIYTVRVNEDYKEPLGLYLIVVAESGERKTPTVRVFRTPYDQAQEILRKHARPKIAEAKAKREILEREKQSVFGAIGSIQKELGKLLFAQSPEDETKRNNLVAQKERHKQHIVEINTNLEGHEIPPEPLLWLTEGTPEAIAKLLAEQESLVVFASEGDIIDVAAGQYSDKTGKLGVLLSAYSMDTHVESRVEGMRAAVNPRLTIVLAVQPGLVEKLQSVREFQQRGLTPRFLYASPRSNVGNRSWASNVIVDPRARATYERIVASMLGVNLSLGVVGVDDALEDVVEGSEDSARMVARSDEQCKGPLPPQKELRLSPEALARFQQYGLTLEGELGDDESSLSEFRTWGNKLPGQMLRLAGTLHLLARGEVSDTHPWETPIDVETVDCAIALAQYFKAHTLSLFVGRQRSLRYEQIVLDWLKHNGQAEFTVRDLFRSRRRRFSGDLKKLHTTLDRLEQMDWVRLASVQWIGRGRPPKRYSVNPHLWKELHRGATQTNGAAS